MEWGTVGGGSRKRASLVRPRRGAERRLLEDEDVAAIADHMDQADSEFVAKMCIACAFLSCLLTWLAWSSSWDRNGRKRAGGRRGPRVQPRPPLRTTSSLDSLSDSASSPIQGVGAADGCHRGALAADRSQPHQQQQQDEGRNQGQRQDGMNEFYNPLWGQRGASHCCGKSWPQHDIPLATVVCIFALSQRCGMRAGNHVLIKHHARALVFVLDQDKELDY